MTTLLATYEFTDGANSPAIFTTPVIPEDASYPAVIVGDIVSSSPFGTRDQRGGESLLEVRVYADKDRTNDDIVDLANAIWRCLDRSSLDLSADGYAASMCMADPPISLVDEDGFPGYLIRVKIRFHEL